MRVKALRDHPAGTRAGDASVGMNASTASVDGSAESMPTATTG
jgi:hypothetical protein